MAGWPGWPLPAEAKSHPGPTHSADPLPRRAIASRLRGVLIPYDIVRLKSPMLRARLTAHLLDEPGPDRAELQRIFDQAVDELLRDGFSVADIAAGTFLEEREVRRRLLGRPLSPPAAAAEPRSTTPSDAYGDGSA